MTTEAISEAFSQAQLNSSNHNRNHINLRKLFKSLDDDSSVDFIKGFIGAVERSLNYQKSKNYVDRTIAFATTYLNYSINKDLEELVDVDESPTINLASDLLKHFLKGFKAKDKFIRFKCVQIVNLILSFIGAMDEDLFDNLQSNLLEKLLDKEANVRAQATLALCKLQGSDDEDLTTTNALINSLQSDPSHLVRRTALINIFPTQHTVLPLLTRVRDVDAITRKSVFEGSKLSEYLKEPKSIRLSPRENVIRAGLGDRDSNVKQSCSNLLSIWLDKANGDLQVFLEYFDVIDSRVAQDALISLFSNKPDVFNDLKFEDSIWNNLSIEQAFLARVYVDYCVQLKDYQKLDNLPVVTAMAFHIQHAYNNVVTLSQTIDDNNDEESYQLSNKQFVLSELLKLALNLDYGDEIGRRKMFNLMRDVMSQPNLPEPLIPSALDILDKLSSSERDFLLLVLEIISELRDLRVNDDDDFEENDDDGASTVMMTPAKAKNNNSKRELTEEEFAHNAEIDLRSLAVVIGMLERVNTTLVENSALGGLLPDLVVPSVRSKEALVRERGLHALGLVCLLADTLAIGSFQMFMNQAESAPEPLDVQSLKIVVDLLMTHDLSLFEDKGGISATYISQFLLRSLDGHSPQFQAVACEGVSKLMLSGIITDPSILRGLLYVYFSPEVTDNQPLKQCLSYFFPVFAFSSSIHQRRMKDTTLISISDHWDREPEEQAHITVSQIATLLAEWTDPRNLVENGKLENSEYLQSELAVDTLAEILKVEEKENRKTLTQFLQKLYISSDTSKGTVKLMLELIKVIQDQRPLVDALSRNGLTKMMNSLNKQFDNLIDDDIDDENQEKFNEIMIDAGLNEDATPRKKTEKTAPTPRAATRYLNRKNSNIPQKRRAPKQVGKSKVKLSRKETISSIESENDDDNNIQTPAPTRKSTRAPKKEGKYSSFAESSSSENQSEQEITDNDSEDEVASTL